MTGLGNNLHEEELDKFIEELEEEGYRVIKLNGKSPDGVAVRVKEIHRGLDHEVESIEFEVSAVEALSSHYKKGKGWKKRFTYTQKQKDYAMFDDVLIHVFKMDPNVSKSSYCNYGGCNSTKIREVETFDNGLYFCEAHMKRFTDEFSRDHDKSEFVYWCSVFLKKSIFKILDK